MTNSRFSAIISLIRITPPKGDRMMETIVTALDVDFEQDYADALASGLTPIMAIYAVHDTRLVSELAKGTVVSACSPNCGHCCHQLITVTHLEWLEIERCALELHEKQRYWLRRRAGQAHKSWVTYQRKLDSWRMTNTVANVFQTYKDWLGKESCPFLNQEECCDVYTARPIQCRGYLSTSKCTGREDENGGHQFHFDFQLWANNKIAELDERFSVAPVPYLAGTLPL